jgi:sialate O-acetylesterase
MRFPCIRPVVALLMVGCIASACRADVTLHQLFTDNMVLQRDRAVPLWGRATAGEAITLQLGGTITLNTITGKDGRWEVTLPAQAVNATPQELTVRGRNNQVVLKNVVFGDVWLCGGQSNMGLSLAGCNAPDDISQADLPQLRAITVPYLAAERPADDLDGVQPQWTVCSPQTVGGFSAAAYYFGRRIQKETGVPVGLLISNVGGTNIEKWMPREAIYSTLALSGIANTIDKALAEYRADVAKSLTGLEAWTVAAKRAIKISADIPPMPTLPRHPFLPGSKAGGNWIHLYNGMIHPLGRYPIRGAIWYQGENNGNEQYTYAAKMSAMIAGWRKRWGYEFPFYYVQLANWLKPTDDPSGGPDGWQYCRMAQLQSLAIPKTGMAIAIDIGDAEDIHPKDKFDVGERLALWALAKDYGKRDLVYSGPLYKKAHVEGKRIRISFDSVGDGLIIGKKQGRNPVSEVVDGKLERFAIAGEDRKWHWANAAIEGQTVVVSSPVVLKPVAVRYAFSMNPDGCNLYNRAGLPASPFRTDEW